jgi:hypothetical protein
MQHWRIDTFSKNETLTILNAKLLVHLKKYMFALKILRHTKKTVLKTVLHGIDFVPGSMQQRHKNCFRSL